jgi:hypothetical protein
VAKINVRQHRILILTFIFQPSYKQKKSSPYNRPLWRRGGGGRGIALLIRDLGARSGGWSAPRPGRFTPGKDPVPIVQEAGWAPGPVWTCAKYLAPTGIRLPDRPARSKSLYRLIYPDPQHCYTSTISNFRALRYKRSCCNNHISMVYASTRIILPNTFIRQTYSRYSCSGFEIRKNILK